MCGWIKTVNGTNNIQEKSDVNIMKKLSFRKAGIENNPIKHWSMRDGTFVAIYQGSRGANPELDFIVKFLSPGKRLRAPSHTHWIVDLLIKGENAKQIVHKYVDDWIKKYDTIEPFMNYEERMNYELTFVNEFEKKYSALSMIGQYSTEFLSTLIELFIKCEKQSPKAFMFKNLLNMMKEYCEGKKDFYQVVSYSKRV